MCFFKSLHYEKVKIQYKEMFRHLFVFVLTLSYNAVREIPMQNTVSQSFNTLSKSNLFQIDLIMSSSIYLVVVLAMASLVASAEESEFDSPSFDVVSDDLSRTLYLNSTGLAYGVAIGAVVILVAAVGLYLYDYYYGTARTDPIPGYAADKYYEQYYQDQAQNGEYAYADSSQYYRYVTRNQIVFSNPKSTPTIVIPYCIYLLFYLNVHYGS